MIEQAEIADPQFFVHHDVKVVRSGRDEQFENGGGVQYDAEIHHLFEHDWVESLRREAGYAGVPYADKLFLYQHMVTGNWVLCTWVCRPAFPGAPGLMMEIRAFCPLYLPRVTDVLGLFRRAEGRQKRMKQRLMEEQVGSRKRQQSLNEMNTEMFNWRKKKSDGMTEEMPVLYDEANTDEDHAMAARLADVAKGKVTVGV